MAITTVQSGTIGLDDFREFGYRLRRRCGVVPDSDPPAYQESTVVEAFARYVVLGDVREFAKPVTLTQAKASTGLLLARTLVADVAAAEGVNEGSV